jgi:hypothetical protein
MLRAVARDLLRVLAGVVGTMLAFALAVDVAMAVAFHV